MRQRSSMVQLAREYLAYRRDLGFELDMPGKYVLQFATYVDRTKYRGPLTIALALRWAQLPKGTTLVYRAQRLAAIRSFAKYCAVFDPATEIPPPGLLGPAHFRTTPYIYSEAELSVLLATARNLPPPRNTFLPGKELRPHTYVTFFGLLACTGMRVSEALKLTRTDVDWDQGVLTIRMTKFRKSRLVPMHSSTILAMRRYAELRDRILPLAMSDAFFVSTRGTALSYSVAETTFIRYLRPQLSWSPQTGGRAPRIHDFRHTFACRRLLQWCKEGANIDHCIAALSTYLGHVEVRDTYWYLTGVPELFALVAARFEQFALSQPGERP